MGKRILSVVLASAVCLSLLAAPVSAAETGGSCWDVVDLEAGNIASYAVTASGDLYGWGRLPLENREESAPHKLQSGVKAVAAATSTNVYNYGSPANGTYFFIKQNGDLYGVGSNDHYQLGQGTKDGDAHADPVLIMSGVREVVANGAAIAAITTNNDLYMWGHIFNNDGNPDNSGQVGSTEPRLLMSAVKDVSMCDKFVVVLKTDGSVYSMGWEIASEWPEAGASIVLPKLHTDWRHRLDNCVAIAVAGEAASYAVKSDGTLWGWGDNSLTMLGRDYERRSSTVVKNYPNPVLVADGGVVDVSAAQFNAYFRKSDGSLWALGENHYGEMGQGDLSFDTQPNGDWYASHPYKVADKVDRVDAGNSFCLYTTTDGRMWGFGLNNFHQLGHERKGLSYHNSVGSGTVAYPVLSGLSVLPGPSSRPQKPAEPTGSFSDVPKSAYYYEGVEWATKQGIVDGTGNGKFTPNRTCTQAEILTLLWRAKGEPTPWGAYMNEGYYSGAFQWAWEQLLVKADLDLHAPCTRGDVVTYLWKLAGSPPQNGMTFSDISPSDSYFQAVIWALGEDITQGNGDGTFRPNDTCTRGQIATFLYRALAD